MEQILTARQKIFFILACALMLLALALQFYSNIGDKVWLLWSAHQWLEGKKLYIDIIEVDPPLIIWLYALPAALANHWDALQTHHYLTLIGAALIAWVVALCLRLIKHHPAFKGATQKALFALLLGSLFITYQNPLYFMDREHLFFVLTFAYMLRFSPSLSGIALSKTTRLVIGIMAGIGYCIKPHCLILLAAVNLVSVVQTRSFFILKSLENLAIYTIGLSYAACILILTPEYINTVLPIAWETYAAHNRKIGGLFIGASVLFSFGVTFADFRLRHTSPYRRDIYYYLGLTPFFLLYALAGNGWGYTWNLLACMGLFINGMVLWEQHYLKAHHEKQGLFVKSFAFGITACMGVFIYNLFIPTDIALLLSPCQNDVFACEDGQQFIQDVRNLNNGKLPRAFSAMTLDNARDFSNWPQFTNTTGIKWSTHFNQLWMLPQFYASGASFTANHTAIRDYVARAYAQDLAHDKPELIFVSDTDHFFNVQKQADVPLFLSANAELKDELQHYRFMGKLEDMYSAAHQSTHHGFFVYQRIVN